MKDLFDIPFEEPPPSRDLEPPEPARRIYTVSEVTAEIRELVETRFFEVWIEGEISNCRLWNTGHLYFTLKDSAAQMKAVMFRSALRYLKFKPEDGLRVVARGRISVYDPKGEYQLVCEHLEPHGFGARQLAFEQLKKRLQAEGLFNQARKRPLPELPKKIGLVTSLDGAAVRDILKVLGRRYPGAHVVIAPARVQGEDAAPEVARAIRWIGRVRGVDVVIVGRGGGSIEDLWAFNEEQVARAILACPVPVISAVGHETDVTIADFVADLRAPTPSAAAELVVARRDEFCARIDRLTGRLQATIRQRVQQRTIALHALARRPAFAGWPGRLAMRSRDAGELTYALGRAARSQLEARQRRFQALRLRLESQDVRRRLADLRGRIREIHGRLKAAVERRRHRADVQWRSAVAALESMSPLAVLARGYAVCWNEARTAIIRDSAKVTPGDRVHVTLARGRIDCAVEGRDLDE